ncbi:hypothetical protein PoB_006400000 [Plakobranchus ocellatus]|uniref:Apple domain-containing protein n=1 Tax=Plakobranchus ocellatus TaxID=259542 RepID=A0AAV4D045_9GAST|nr:hypothetical protein PoB_006400000 [Plakobranchus ocellatus]
MKSGFEWERRPCQEENSFICETTKFPYPESYARDSTTGMLIVSRETGQSCRVVCNQVYGCYRTSPLGNSSCILDLVLESNSDDNIKAYRKPLVVNAKVMSFTSSQMSEIRERFDDGSDDDEEEENSDNCTPPAAPAAPDGLVSYNDAKVPVIVNSVEPCPTATVIESQTCTAVQPSASTIVQTTTVFDTITLTPSASIVPTTVVHTDTVTMTTRLFSSCSQELVTVSSSCEPVQLSASRLTYTTVVYSTVLQTPEVSIVPTTIVVTDTVTTTQAHASCTPSVHTEVSTFTYTATASVPTHTCASQASVNNQTREEIEQAVSSIVSELRIDVQATSKARAKFKSAPDSRVSSQAMGVVSLAFIGIVMLLIFSIDAPNIYFVLKDRMDRWHGEVPV